MLALGPSPAISWPLIGRVFSAHWDKLMASLPSPYLLLVILRWIRTISSYPVISVSVSVVLHTYHWPDLPWTWQMNSLWASTDLIDFGHNLSSTYLTRPRSGDFHHVFFYQVVYPVTSASVEYSPAHLVLLFLVLVSSGWVASWRTDYRRTVVPTTRTTSLYTVSSG